MRARGLVVLRAAAATASVVAVTAASVSALRLLLHQRRRDLLPPVPPVLASSGNARLETGRPYEERDEYGESEGSEAEFLHVRVFFMLQGDGGRGGQREREEVGMLGCTKLERRLVGGFYI